MRAPLREIGHRGTGSGARLPAGQGTRTARARQRAGGQPDASNQRVVQVGLSAALATVPAASFAGIAPRVHLDYTVTRQSPATGKPSE
jgi:hypothetical protein